MTLRIILAEDNFMLREGVKSLIATQGDLELAAACDDFDSLMRAVEQHAPDVVITDIRMPPTGTDEGVRAANELRSSHPQMGVLVLSQYSEPAYAVDLFEKGSQGRGYLLKERVSDLDQLVSAIKDVAAGGSVIDPKIVDILVKARSRHADSPLKKLTPRETEVLSEMAQGRNNTNIAKTLFLSERAVEKHINAIFSKLALGEEKEVHRRVKAVLLYLSEGRGEANPT